MIHLLKIRTSIDIFKNEKCKVTFGLEYITFVELEYIMLHAKFHDHKTISSVGDFYHIWTWPPSWSFDLDHFYKLSLPLPK